MFRSKLCEKRCDCRSIGFDDGVTGDVASLLHHVTTGRPDIGDSLVVSRKTQPVQNLRLWQAKQGGMVSVNRNEIRKCANLQPSGVAAKRLCPTLGRAQIERFTDGAFVGNQHVARQIAEAL